MDIQIVNHKVTHYPNLGLYVFAEMRSGKHHMTMVFGSRDVQVCVHNASNRAWRGLGKTFPNVEKAMANYKTAEIRAMIAEGARLHQEAVKAHEAAQRDKLPDDVLVLAANAGIDARDMTLSELKAVHQKQRNPRFADQHDMRLEHAIAALEGE